MNSESKPRANLDLANGYLLEAGDLAARLKVVLGFVEDVVAKRISPPFLVGEPIADFVEQHANLLVVKIREAVKAKEGR